MSCKRKKGFAFNNKKRKTDDKKLLSNKESTLPDSSDGHVSKLSIQQEIL